MDLLKPHVPPLTLSGDISVELLKRVSKRWLVCLLLSGGGASGEIIYETHVVWNWATKAASWKKIASVPYVYTFDRSKLCWWCMMRIFFSPIYFGFFFCYSMKDAIGLLRARKTARFIWGRIAEKNPSIANMLKSLTAPKNSQILRTERNTNKLIKIP